MITKLNHFYSSHLIEFYYIPKRNKFILSDLGKIS